jgi:hypothetical protein
MVPGCLERGIGEFVLQCFRSKSSEAFRYEGFLVMNLTVVREHTKANEVWLIRYHPEMKTV